MVTAWDFGPIPQCVYELKIGLLQKNLVALMSKIIIKPGHNFVPAKTAELGH